MRIVDWASFVAVGESLSLSLSLSENPVVIYKAYIRPLLEYNSHLWSGAPPTILAFVDRLQRRAIRLIGDSRVTRELDSLEHRRNVGALALYYRYFHGRCSDEIGAIMPPLRTYMYALPAKRLTPILLQSIIRSVVL